MKIEIGTLMQSVLKRILEDEIYFQERMIEEEIDNDWMHDDARDKIIDECHRIINEIYMNGDVDE